MEWTQKDHYMVTVLSQVNLLVSVETIGWSFPEHAMPTARPMPAGIITIRAGIFLYIPVTKDATRIVANDDTKGKFTVVESVSLGNELC